MTKIAKKLMMALFARISPMLDVKRAPEPNPRPRQSRGPMRLSREIFGEDF